MASAMSKAIVLAAIFVAWSAVDAAQFPDPPCYGVQDPQCSDADLDVIASTQGTSQTWFDMLDQASYISLGDQAKAVKSLGVQAANNGVKVSATCFDCQARSATCNFFKCGFSKCVNPTSRDCLKCMQEHCALSKLCGGDPAKINLPEDEHGPATWLRSVVPDMKCVKVNASTPHPAPGNATFIPVLTPAPQSTELVGAQPDLKKIQDCEVSAWIEWSSCAKTCGGGTRERARTILREASPSQMQCVPTRLGPITAEECGVLTKVQCQAEPLCSWKLQRMAGRDCPHILHQVARCNSRSCVPLPEECSTADDKTGTSRLKVTAVYNYVPPGGSLTKSLGIMDDISKYVAVKQTQLAVFPCRGLYKIQSATSAGECQEFCFSDVGCNIWSWNDGCYQSNGVGTQLTWCSGESLSRLDIWGQIVVWGSASLVHENRGLLAEGLVKVQSLSDVDVPSLGKDLCQAVCLSSLDCGVWQWGENGCWVEDKPFYAFKTFVNDHPSQKVTAGETILHSCDAPKYKAPRLQESTKTHLTKRNVPHDRDASGGQDENHKKKAKKPRSRIRHRCWFWCNDDDDDDEDDEKPTPRPPQAAAQPVPPPTTTLPADIFNYTGNYTGSYNGNWTGEGEGEKVPVAVTVGAFGVSALVLGGLASVTSHHVPFSVFGRSFHRSRSSAYRHVSEALSGPAPQQDTARSLETVALTGPVDL